MAETKIILMRVKKALHVPILFVFCRERLCIRMNLNIFFTLCDHKKHMRNRCADAYEKTRPFSHPHIRAVSDRRSAALLKRLFFCCIFVRSARIPY